MLATIPYLAHRSLSVPPQQSSPPFAWLPPPIPEAHSQSAFSYRAVSQLLLSPKQELPFPPAPAPRLFRCCRSPAGPSFISRYSMPEVAAAAEGLRSCWPRDICWRGPSGRTPFWAKSRERVPVARGSCPGLSPLHSRTGEPFRKMDSQVCLLCPAQGLEDLTFAPKRGTHSDSRFCVLCGSHPLP